MSPLMMFGDHSSAEQAKGKYDNSRSIVGEKRQEVETHVAAKIFVDTFRRVPQ